MIKVEVYDEKIFTQIRSEKKCNIAEEIGNACAELLAEFQAELIRRGNPREVVDAAFQEMMQVISEQNRQRVDSKLTDNTTAM